jgi:hypothetical protein
MILDFYTETSAPLVEQVSNKIYFQAYATRDRVDVYEFANASLKAVLSDGSVKTVIDNAIMTVHRGKGSFTFIHNQGYQELFLEVPVYQLGSREPVFVRRDLKLRHQVPFPQALECSFSVATKNKVFDSKKGLEVLIATNDLIQPTDYYMLTLRLKEKVIHQEELQLKKSSSRTIKILPKVALAGTVGGVMTLNLYRINQSYYT